ncbi:MAG: DNA-protecting protein DprA [Lachnospiraceae bacterium]|jgi:DNA processing protein|nr:DNA-protecting protein DprA [Lachnospiraceae bacterium]
MEKIEEEQLPYAHWLYNIPGVGRKTIKYLLSEKGTPEAVYHMSQKELECLLDAMHAKSTLAERIIDSKKDWNIKRAYENLKEKGIRFTCLGDEKYPGRLAQIPDAPYGLYFQGKLLMEERPSVAIIGARNCSEYGRRMAQHYGRELAAAGIQIISGMARGIDGISQKAALDAEGFSLGVLGCGVDICYPAENRELYEMLCKRGGICSEYPPGTEPKNSLFPPRNRIISGLSDVVLVIEAKNRSGTLITVDMALEQGREVYALPGRVTDALSEGCNRLIQQGAAVAFSAEDMIHSLTGRETGNSRMGVQRSGKALLSDMQKALLENLEDTPQSPEIIKERMLSKGGSELTLPELMNQLVKLSLMGYARQIGNSYFVKE